MNRLKEFKDLSLAELDVAYTDTRKELFNLVNEWQRTKKLEKPHQLRTKRKEIAQLLTLKTEKQHEKPKAKETKPAGKEPTGKRPGAKKMAAKSAPRKSKV